MKKINKFLKICSLVAVALCLSEPLAIAQTFEINNQPEQKPADKKKNEKNQPAAPAPAGGGQIGWGSSIEVGRQSRAAEDALRRGNVQAAATYAKRAVDAAPQNNKLWFLYGYTARLAGRYNESISAYKRGLQGEPNSIDGLSGLAQTYAKMGRTEEAKRLLVQVINADPRRVNDLLIAGEIFMRAGDVQQGMNYLERAEAIQPSAHAELLMATAYMKLKQPEKAKSLLEKAKRRDPKNTDIFRAVATFYRESKDYAQAIATLKAAPKMKPEVLGDLAFTYEIAGYKKEAAATYARVAEMESGQIGYQLSAANAYLRMEDMEKVRKFIARAAKIDPNHYRLHALQASVAKIEGRPADAIREYQLALKNIPEVMAEGPLYPIQLRLNLAELLKGQGDDAGARQQMQLAEAEISKIEVGGEAKAEFLRVRASIKSSSDDLVGAEKDLKEALALDPQNINIQLQYANLLWRAKRKEEARNLYLAILKADPKSRYALEGLGYIAREENNIPLAEQYFKQLAAAYPDDHVAFLALGDMYTALRRFPDADVNYQRAFKLAPKVPAVVANGANAALEDRKFDLAKVWVERASGSMLEDPRVMRERERYLFHTGNYLESAALGYKVLEKLPKDRNASVYLAYALYNLGRFDDVLSLSSRFETLLPREPNFPLLMGHVHKQTQLLTDSVDDYSRAIERDPKMAEAYVNRGYVLNDLQNSERAVQDFNTALKLNPNNGVAHLGIAFSDLQLRKAGDALQHVEQAERLIGESGPTHLVRATAYRQQRVLDKAETHYRAAMKYSPDDLGLHLALADTLYHARKYNEAVSALSDSLRLSPDDPFIYAQLASSNAQLKRNDDTMRYVEAAEREGGDQATVLLATGEALMMLGETDAAMERFARSLEAPDSNRVDSRLAIARLFARDRKFEDAKQQVALAFAEARIGEASPVSADNFVEAANIFLQAQDFALARDYFERARDAGAAEQAVAIGMANAFLAVGDDRNAEASLASLGAATDYTGNYDYMLIQANIYKQRHDNVRALGAFARANASGPEDDVAERQQQEVAGEVGIPLRGAWTTGYDVVYRGTFEDSTIYTLDAQLFGVAANPDLLPPPRSSSETLIQNNYNYNRSGMPTVTTSFMLRNANGEVSLPSENLVLNRRTVDMGFSGGIAPVLRLGGNRIVFNAGAQFTLRRDGESPVELNQNLVRPYAYFSTSSFGNWLSARGQVSLEKGSFTKRDLNSRDAGAKLEFTVGRPWGRTAMITGWSARNLQFDPLIREFFTTSTYVGLQRKFGRSLQMTVLGEFVRSWRVQDTSYAIAQAMRPGMNFEYRPNNRWSFEGNFAFERGQGFHAYDNVQSGIYINYVKPFRSSVTDGFGVVPVDYPVRISFGIQQAQYLNITGRGSSLFRPVVRLSLF